MDKRIGTVLYRTSTSHKVGTWNNGAENKLDMVEETLYRKVTNTSTYFLHGKGGARTQYARTRKGTLIAGEDIKPLPFTEAKKWAEEHLTEDEFRREFCIAEDEGSERFNLRIPSAIASKIRIVAKERNITISALVAELAEKYL